MYRVTVTQDPKHPSAVVYQGEMVDNANTEFWAQANKGENTCVTLATWVVSQSKKRGQWKTIYLFKHYQ